MLQILIIALSFAAAGALAYSATKDRTRANQDHTAPHSPRYEIRTTNATVFRTENYDEATKAAFFFRGTIHDTQES